MKLLKLAEISNIYGMGINFWRTYLCRPEFKKYIWDARYIFCDIPEFHNEIKKLLDKKRCSINTRRNTLKDSPTG